MGLNHTPESKVMAVWFSLVLPCLITSVLIYCWPESDIRVKSFACLKLPKAFLFKFECLDIWWALIIYSSQKLWLFEFVESFLVLIRVSQYMMGLNHTLESKVMAVWIWLALPCLILSVSIYYWLELDIRVKSYGFLNFLRAFLFKFEPHDILLAWHEDPSQKLRSFKFDLWFHV